jgi:hypothetical protein
VLLVVTQNILGGSIYDVGDYLAGIVNKFSNVFVYAYICSYHTICYSVFILAPRRHPAMAPTLHWVYLWPPPFATVAEAANKEAGTWMVNVP